MVSRMPHTLPEMVASPGIGSAHAILLFKIFGRLAAESKLPSSFSEPGAREKGGNLRTSPVDIDAMDIVLNNHCRDALEKFIPAHACSTKIEKHSGDRSHASRYITSYRSKA